MNINFGELVVLLLFGTPIIISLWFTLKIANIQIKSIRSLNINEKDRKKRIIKLVLSVSIIIVIVILAIYLLILVFSRNMIKSIPLAINLALMFMLFTFYGCFIALFIGLTDLVGAGGSATSLIKEIANLLCDYFDIDQKN